MRFVEPDTGNRPRRDVPPGVRSSATGVLVAAALIIGGTVTGLGTATPAAAATCDSAASGARLVDARRLATALRVDTAPDPRRTALTRDLARLGITPAVSTGWRQDAVDVSDRLQGTTDPALQRVAVALARSGTGPTPADLVRTDSGPLPDLLNVGNQTGGTRITDAIDAAGQALGEVPSNGAPTGPARPSGAPVRPDRPTACTPAPGSGAASGTSEPDRPDHPGTPVVPDGSRTNEPPSPSSTTAAPAAREPDDSEPGAHCEPNTAPGDASHDLCGAAEAVQAVADLLRNLSVQPSPDAQQLAEQLRRLLPDSTGSKNGPDRGSPDAADAEQPDTVPEDWLSQARELAERAHQAAPTDPLARDLAAKLDAAGLDDGSAEEETPESSSTSATPDPTQPAAPPSPSTTDGSEPASHDVDDRTEPESRGDVRSSTWDRLADCESSGDWAADTGNGYAGGLQFDPATWTAFGGAGPANEAGRDEQIAVAEKVLAAQGWRAWPACSATLGLL